MRKPEITPFNRFEAHLKETWRGAHHIVENLNLNVSSYTKAEIDAFFEGYSAGKAQVHWDWIMSKPSTYPPSSHTHDDRYYTETELDAFFEGEASGKKQVDWARITSKPSTFPPGSHQHPGTDITSIVPDSDKLDGNEAAAFQFVGMKDIANGYCGLDENILVPLARIPTPLTNKHVAWTTVDDKPSTFPPSSHSHGRSDITDFWSSAFWSSIPDKPSTFPPSSHTHPGTDITSIVAETAKLTASGFSLDTLIANNKVPDSQKWNGYDLPTLIAEKVLTTLDGVNLTWWRANLDWLSDVNLNKYITAYESCLLARDSYGDWVAGKPEYDIRFLSYEIKEECWNTTPPSPWAYGALVSGTVSAIGSSVNHPGQIRIVANNIGTSNSGYYFIAANNIIVIGGKEQFDFVFQPSTIALTNIRMKLGFQDVLTVSDPTDGIYFYFSADATLRGACISNTAKSTTASSYTISQTWYRARAIVNSGATLVTFRLYSMAGTLLWEDTISSNIPTGDNRAVGFGGMAWYAADGDARDIVYLDLMDFICARGLIRG